MSAIKFADSAELVPKSLIFCLIKEICYAINVHLWKNVSCNKRHWFGIYHESMSEGGKAVNQHKFKCGEICIIIASSAFGLGVDIPDVVWLPNRWTHVQSTGWP